MQNKINSKMINNRKSPIQDDYIEKYLAEKELNLTATWMLRPHTPMLILLSLRPLLMSTQQTVLT